jgi:hypothetical protein
MLAQPALGRYAQSLGGKAADQDALSRIAITFSR